MKTKYSLMLIVGLFFYQGLAHAEMLSGIVTHIDMPGQTVTLHRADNNAEVTIHVKDKNALAGLETGSQINVDANKKLWGKWETQSISAPGSASSQTPANNNSEPGTSSSSSGTSDSGNGVTNSTSNSNPQSGNTNY